MHYVEENKEREERIFDEAIVDAYGKFERATGWECYLNDKITFPFDAICFKSIIKSPLKIGEKVTVLDIVEEYEVSTINVRIEWNNREFGVPLEQLKPVNVDEQTQESIEDWHYWVARGYGF